MAPIVDEKAEEERGFNLASLCQIDFRAIKNIRDVILLGTPVDYRPR